MPSRSKKVYVITDLHYVSSYTFDEDMYKTPRVIDAISFRETRAIIEQAFDTFLKDDEASDIIVLGDLTANGDIESHLEVKELLKKVAAKGKKLYAIYASHDMPCWKQSWRINEHGKKRYIEPNGITADKCAELYSEFGRDTAYAKSPYNFSYVVNLNDDITYIAIDADYYGENYPTITNESMAWIKEQTMIARNNGKFVFAGLHYPLMPPSPIYNIISKHDSVKDADTLVEKFADMGLCVFFTGHTHMHDIAYKTAKNGATVYDITTSTCCGYPPLMRSVTIFPDKKTISINTITIKTPKELNYIDDLSAYTKESFIGYVEKLIRSMENDIDSFAEMADSISIRPATSYKHRKLIHRLGKFLNHLTFGKIARFVKKESGLKKKDYAPIKDEPVVPFLVSIIEKLYDGKQDISPDGMEYKITMGVVAVLDSIVSALRINLKKLIGVNKLSEIVEPLLYNGDIDNYDAIINLDKIPKHYKYPTFKSSKGWKIVTCLVLTAIILSPVLLPTAIIIAIIIKLKKSKQNRGEVNVK